MPVIQEKGGHYTFDGRNLLTGIINTNPDATNKKYYYDANGNQASVVAKDSAAGTTKTDTYVYDELNQLTPYQWQ